MAARLAQRLALSLLLIGLAAVALIGAGGLLTAAFYLWMLDSMEPPGAAMATAGVLLVAALLFFVLSRVAFKAQLAERVPQVPPESDARLQAAQAISSLAGEEIGRFLHEKPKSATAIALVAGLAIGLSPELRGALGQLLKPEDC